MGATIEVDRFSLTSCETKIGKDSIVPLAMDKDVFRLEIPVENTVSVAMLHCIKNLKE